MKSHLHRGIIPALIVTVLTALYAPAEVVYVTARPSPCTVTANCTGPNTDGTYSEQSINLGDFGAVGTALGHPQTTVARTYIASAELADPNAGVTLTPTLGVPGGIYQIDYNFNSAAGNTSTNVVLSVNCTSGGTLSFTETDKFQRSFGNPANQWQLLGYLTNDAGSATPTLEFRYQSGRVSGAGAGAAANRLLFDCWRFTLVEPCLSVPTVSVRGPLSTNVNEVVVAGVDAAATAITVYQDKGAGMIQIGEKTSGVTVGNNTVTVSGLVKGAQVAAAQTIGGQRGCTPTVGAIVGGGANPSIRVALTVRENTALTGPVGAAGSGSIVSFLGASSTLVGGAPADGIVLQPSNDWQTVSFTNAVDPFVTWAGTDATPGTWDGPFGALDGVAIACEGDNGPFDIYFDDFDNGTHGVFQGFESAAANSIAYAFSQPSQSGSSLGIMAAPNDSRVVDTTAASGSKSMRVRFQFTSTATNNWLRLVTSGNSGAPVNPQLDVIEPISFKILLLPLGATVPPPAAPGPLSISVVGSNIVLDWTGSYPLQSSANVAGQYLDVGVTTGPYTNNITGAQQYFRLRGN